MNKSRSMTYSLVFVFWLVFVCVPTFAGNDLIMDQLSQNAGGKTHVVKDFPDEFPEVLTSRGKPLVYTKENSENFEYIGMPIGGICAGQLYLGGDGKLWFWDIFNLNYRRGQLKGEDAYQYPYRRSNPEEKGARVIEQGFSIRVKSGDKYITKRLDRDGIKDIEFLGQYPVGQVSYRDPELPVDVDLEAFSPFVPLDLESSILPATVLNFRVKNTSDSIVQVDVAGWLENAVLTGSRREAIPPGKLLNRIAKVAAKGLRLECSAEQAVQDERQKRADIVFEDFEKGYGEWSVSGNAFGSDGKPYYHREPLKNVQGRRLADSMNQGDAAQGKMVSKSFTIQRSFLRCLIAGGRDRKNTCLNVLVDGKIAASAAGDNSEHLKEAYLDLSGYEGKQARIEIVDTSSGGWGHVLVDEILFTDSPEIKALDQMPDFGTMSLALMGGPRETCGQAKTDLSTPAMFSGSLEAAVQKLKPEGSLVGSLSKRMELAPGAERDVTFVLTWHFPMARVGKGQKRYYAEKFEDAFAVSDHVINNFDRLAGQTRLWRDTWYDSTLPYWFLDRTFLNASILASSTSHLFADGRFYGFEGGYQGPGTCTHVWGYVQAMGRLFPQLEISLREKTDLLSKSQGGSLNDNGVIEFRGRYGYGLAVDGQSGTILRSYLAHQMSADDAFLRRNYHNIKKAMSGLTDMRDSDHDGILTGPQHNTLDANWYGKVTWLSLYYQAALRAVAEMADEIQDHDYAKFCRETADKGRKYIEDHLFNGEYFFHEADPEHPDSPGIYTGCEYSQLLGQSWAYQLGLGPIIDPAKTKTALESLWRYNFSTDVGPFRQVNKTGRWYAMPGEGGLIACTWPRGGSEVLKIGNPRHAAYNNECQNGYEYACTSLMMWHGMPYHALAHIWYLHNDRYHGSKRNPWCEVEWGCHYSRSMASYGHFTGSCGYEYHGPKDYIAFAPNVMPEDFRAAFTAAQGWGTYLQKRHSHSQQSQLKLAWGQLCVKSLKFEVPQSVNVKKVLVNSNGKNLPSHFSQQGDRIAIKLADKIVLKADQDIKVEIVWEEKK